MNLRDDFNVRIVDRPQDAEWQPSPMTGVERRMLDRIGGEVARATSIVRYAPGAGFHRHVHGGGEELLVLEGVFSDERGDYPAGTYVRNPPGSSHTPFSREGCVLFVKLWQFAADDLTPERIDTRTGVWREGMVPGLRTMHLHAHRGVDTAMVRWEPGARFPMHAHSRGEEILVLEGTLHDEHGAYPPLTWIRNPGGSQHTPHAGDEGALIYVKIGHLGAPFLQPQQAKAAP